MRQVELFSFLLCSPCKALLTGSYFDFVAELEVFQGKYVVGCRRPAREYAVPPLRALLLYYVSAPSLVAVVGVAIVRASQVSRHLVSSMYYLKFASLRSFHRIRKNVGEMVTIMGPSLGLFLHPRYTVFCITPLVG